MKDILEPEDILYLSETLGVTPNIEILPGKLRLHFFPEGVAFGLIDPEDDRFAAVVTYEVARKLMLEAAKEEHEDAKP